MTAQLERVTGNDTPSPVRTSVPRGRRRADRWSAALLLTPKIAVFAAFVIVPFCWAFVLVFQQGTLLRGFRWVGFRNITTLISDDLFLQSVKNTLIFVAMVLPASLIIPCVIGSFLAQRRPGAALYRTLIYAPSLLSIVAVGMVFRYLAAPDGGPLYALFNELLGVQVAWLTSPTFTLVYIAIATVWASLGLLSVLFMTGFLAINEEVLDAAVVDGATTWQTFWYVKLPQLRRIFQLVFILVTISAVQVFDLVFVLTKGGPGTSTYTAQWYVYQNVFNAGSMGYAATMGVVLLLLTAVLSAGAALLFRERT